jgi:hypothetical protein
MSCQQISATFLRGIQVAPWPLTEFFSPQRKRLLEAFSDLGPMPISATRVSVSRKGRSLTALQSVPIPPPGPETCNAINGLLGRLLSLSAYSAAN